MYFYGNKSQEWTGVKVETLSWNNDPSEQENPLKKYWVHEEALHENGYSCEELEQYWRDRESYGVLEFVGQFDWSQWLVDEGWIEEAAMIEDLWRIHEWIRDSISLEDWFDLWKEEGLDGLGMGDEEVREWIENAIDERRLSGSQD